MDTYTYNYFLIVCQDKGSYQNTRNLRRKIILKHRYKRKKAKLQV